MRYCARIGLIFVFVFVWLGLQDAAAQAPSINALSATPPGLSQSAAPLQGAAFTLTVNGQAFIADAQVLIDGAAQPTTFVNATQLTTTVPSSVLTVVATLAISVRQNVNVLSNSVNLPVVERGDVNSSRTVTISDALSIARDVGSTQPLLSQTVGDLNLDGGVSIGDALTLALFSGGVLQNLATPTITSVTPTTPQPGQSLTIQGSGFSAAVSQLQVAFSVSGGGIERVTPTQAQLTSLTVTVPAAAVSGVIQVFRLDTPIGGQSFPLTIGSTTAPLLVTAVTPTFVTIPGPVTLQGSGFNLTAANNNVYFQSAQGLVKGTVTGASASSLTVTVPSGALCGGVVVATDAGTSNAKPVIVAGPACGLKLTGMRGGEAAGQLAVLEGTGFTPSSPQDNIVKFTSGGGTVNATVLAAGSTELHVRVPSNAIAGGVTVAIGAATSNSVAFAPVAGGIPGCTTLSNAQAVSASLQNSDSVSANRALAGYAAYSDCYSFSGSAGDRVTIGMTSPNAEIDTYVYLLTVDGQVLAEDDDSGGDHNSEIRAFVLPYTGTYKIDATSYNEATGSYSIVFWFDPITWVQRSQAGSPAPRTDHAMAYDALRGQVVLFGGAGAGSGASSEFNDTWIWDGSAWAQKFPATSPSPRYGAALAYDALHGQTVLLGGQSAFTTFNGNTWVWDGSNWTKKTPAHSPGLDNATAGVMTYDAARQQIVFFRTGFTNGQTWVWDGTDWTQKSPSTSPTPRIDTQMVYDAAHSQIVLFGGKTASGDVSDTWVWDGTNWTQKSPAVSPPARSAFAMTYDPGSGQTTILGGTNTSGSPSSMWTWEGTTWSQKMPTAAPPERTHGVMTFDANRSQIVLFGGLSSPGSTHLGDAWLLGLPSLPVCQSITVGATINGNLNSNSGRSRNRSGSYADCYTFAAATGNHIGILLTSPDFDTFLYLNGPSGQVVASDDDGGGGSNSLIPGTLDLPAFGTYTIEATALNAGLNGNYTLSLTPTGAPSLSSAAPNSGSIGTSISVTLTGANFVPGATTVTVSGTGVTATAVNVTSATSLTATLTIAGNATPGARTLTVTTAAGTSNTISFTVP